MNNIGQAILEKHIPKENASCLSEFVALILGYDVDAEGKGHYKGTWLLKEPFKGFSWKGEVYSAIKKLPFGIKQVEYADDGSRSEWDICLILRVTAFLTFMERNKNNNRIKNTNWIEPIYMKGN